MILPLALAAALATVVLAGLPALAAGGSAPPAPLQDSWSSRQGGLDPARKPGIDGAGVLVAVLDTWVDRTHPDFEGRALVGADCVGGPCRDGQTRDSCNHGTHVAGIVGASSFGTAPQARILPVRVLSYDPATAECTGRPEDVARGIRWSLDQGAQVLNLSLGADVPGLASGPLPAAVREAVARGAVVVFSAGNGDVSVTDAYEGAALVVAATGPDGQLASYSQRGAGVDLAAPGGDAVVADRCTREACVTSLYPDGTYAVAAGTSMAAPMVSGVAALLLAQDPTRSREEVLDLLLSSARPLAGAGAGALDAAAALGVAPAGRPLPAGTVAPQAVPQAVDQAVPQADVPPLPAPAPLADALDTPEPTPGLPFALPLLATVLALGGALGVLRACWPQSPRH